MTNYNIEQFIKRKYTELIAPDKIGVVSKYLYMYENEKNEKLQYLLSYFHNSFNILFSFMNDKLYNGHYNANESRELISLIDDLTQILNALRQYEYSYKINLYYQNIINQCKEFLSSSGGSRIPDDFKKIAILEIEPMFELNESVEIIKNSQKLNAQKKIIGEGSYAKVYKFKDEFYNKYFVIKEAKSDLVAKELERFKIEFETMKKLNSPYILEVYSFNSSKNSYIMEYADITLQKYIYENNNKLSYEKRINIVNQIFKAFAYIHENIGLHRDISTTNILLKKYDNDLLVVKVSDFGLVKLKESTLTSDNTEFRGSLNDPKLNVIGGFKSYKIEHETYALTRLIYFIMTGKIVIDLKFKNKEFELFIQNGIANDLNIRHKSIQEMKIVFNKIKFTKEN